MIARSPAAFLSTYADGTGFPPSGRATLRAALLVTPIGIRVSAESAQDNAYMSTYAALDPERAFSQHNALVRRLGELDVPVVLFPGREGLDDAVFPNNVYATIRGRFIVGAMRHPVRQAEARRADVREFFAQVCRYEIRDLSQAGSIAELTGPLVIDHARAVGFCGMTGRVDEAGLEAMHRAFDLRLTLRFELAPTEYHTNLVLAVLAGRACLIHPPSFVDPDVPRAIARLYGNGSIELSDDEKRTFAGNAIAVTERDVLFSATSIRSLRPRTSELLAKCGFRIHAVAVDEIEKAGGSLRCMIAEVF